VLRIQTAWEAKLSVPSPEPRCLPLLRPLFCALSIQTVPRRTKHIFITYAIAIKPKLRLNYVETSLSRVCSNTCSNSSQNFERQPVCKYTWQSTTLVIMHA
jgi:hypothetical protein